MAHTDIFMNQRLYRLFEHGPDTENPELRVVVSEKTGTRETIYNKIFEQIILPNQTREELLDEAMACIRRHAKLA